jgi:DNA topoisomerase-2
MTTQLHPQKSIEQQYKVLNEIEHVRHRLSVFAGSPVKAKAESYLYNFDSGKMEKKTVERIPALLKVISEAIDNAVDEHKRKGLIDVLKLNIDQATGEITLEDNGGIPIVIHQEFNKYVPEIIFGMLRSGSNYDDDEDQALAGTNGLGVKLLNIMSDYFIVETADGKNYFKQEYFEGMTKKSDPIVKPSNKNFTKLTFKLDFKYFGLTGLDDDHKSLIEKRVVDSAGNNPKLKVYINDHKKPIQFKKIEDYFDLYSKVEGDILLDSNDDWKVGVGSTEDGSEQISFVNNLETYDGGTHVSYALDQVVGKIREFVKKKHKIEVKPSDVKNQIRIFISCNINRPVFNSQNKTHMISEYRDFKTEWEPSDKFIRKILDSSIVENLMNWVIAKQKAEELAELKKLNKDIEKSKTKVKKFRDANEKTDRTKCILMVTEGDSASAPILDVRDPNIIGVFPLKGRVMNVSAQELSTVKDNEETVNLCRVTGLKFGEKVNSLEDLRFGKIMIATDADEFGNAIAAQLINTFYRFWPELFDMGFINRLITPVVKLKYKTDIKYFYSEAEYHDWIDENPEKAKKYEYSFLKGLGSSNQEDFNYYLNVDFKNHQVEFDPVAKDDADTLDLCFLKGPGSADKRKDWLDLL